MATGPFQPIGIVTPARRRWAIVCAAVLVVLCLAGLKLEFTPIASTLPYPQHVDEPAIAEAARQILTTGSLHPATFNYPALPKELAAAGMAVGFVEGATHLDATGIEDIGSVGYPYYNARLPIQTARELFAVISAIALLMTGLCAWLAWREPAAILLAPAMVFFSPLFFYHAWAYLNVDIVGTCLVAATLAAALAGTRRPSMMSSAILPGALAGLAIASKYTLAVAIVPVLIAAWCYVAPGGRLRVGIAAVLSIVAAFLIAAPFTVLDIPHFLDGIASEGYHYANGHAGFDGRPGWPQLAFHLRHFVSDFGWPAAAFAVVGIGVSARADLRRTAIVVSAPVVLLLLLAQARTHFTRNVLPVHPMLGLFAALGVISMCRWVLAWSRTSNPWTRVAGVAGALALVAIAIPWPHVADVFQDRTDSRNVAVPWLDEEVPRDWTIVVPEQLDFDARPLEAHGHHIMTVDLQGATDAEAVDELVASVPKPAVILVPHWGADPYVRGQFRADALNELASAWTPIKTFGREVVEVNHPNHAPFGNPQFGIVALDPPPSWLHWIDLVEQNGLEPGTDRDR